VIDLHSHILPGIDDGARSPADTVALVRAAHAAGVTAIAATPHVRDDYPTTSAQVESGVEAVSRLVRGEGIDVRVLTGGEVALDLLERLPSEELHGLTLGGTGRYLLVEFPYYGWPFTLDSQLRALRARGLVPVLAHPERNPEVQRAPERLERTRRAGALVQVTIDSLTGALGRRARRSAAALLELGLVDLLASDAHSPEAYAFTRRSLAEAVGDRRRAVRLTVTVPSAVAAGEPVP
jgi:protein-tyrosine phosphatase